MDTKARKSKRTSRNNERNNSLSVSTQNEEHLYNGKYNFWEMKHLEGEGNGGTLAPGKFIETHKIRREIEIDGFNSIYSFEFGKDFSHPLEKHDFWEMMYVDSGNINVITDSIGCTLSQGQVIFHRPMELHAHVSNKIVSNNMIVVSFSSRSPAMDFFDKKIFTLDKTAKTLLSLFMRETENALGKIPDDYRNRNPLDFSGAPSDSLQLLECYLTELLLVLRRCGGTATSKVMRSEDSRKIAQNSIAELITEYLKENVYANLSLGDICNKFFIGKSQLCKIFDEYVGESPMEYYSKIKITEAKRLLREEISVSRISDMLSYSSIHSFSRAFKKTAGMPPTEYKKKIDGISSV